MPYFPPGRVLAIEDLENMEISIPIRHRTEDNAQGNTQGNAQGIPEQSNNAQISAEQYLRIKTRRRRYLDLHPEYFSHELELADVLLYDHYIRRFYTPAESAAADVAKGFADALEADLWRAEAKVEAVENPNPNHDFVYYRQTNGVIVSVDKGEEEMDREEAKEAWRFEMKWRFIRGEDDQFNYKTVDENVAYDDPEEERELQDAYLDAADDDTEMGDNVELTGETGIMDY
ncbi:uncharacterized protein BDZ99DRAFT_169906 [Mytilinidion resinicola]|uniref:CCD97-like C-terminal domain-containing protein n=1 Tax=Mytilinidion resinicola TaxID=574789 RepID=A0A6A6Y3Q9_9PEZI|nr:uncharacterized protein BDZ99DRAFT_169906 [Mytilinidion resinicola]KAF2803269.1 hypothetical protein BDZ99DRAFT_169906 [Mytilinidion resinicola]